MSRRHVRVAAAGDLTPLVELAQGTEGLMTTMPRDREHMAERLALTAASVDPAREVDGREVYLFVLDEAGTVTGTSAVYAAVGLDRPFYTFKLTRISKYSPDIDRRFRYTVLQPTNDYSGVTEVGTLYLPPEFRGGGRGRLLSLTRFLFLVVHRERFGDQVMAEMRGWTDEAGRSPFWEAVGKRFFDLELDHADRLSGKEFRFMQDMLPSSPIHVDLLPEEAQAVISVPHPGSAPAAEMLRRLGMRDRGYVDVFDAGLCLDAFIDDLEVTRRARSRRAVVVAPTAGSEPDGHPGLVANTALAGFAVVEANVTARGDQVLTVEQADALGVVDGDPIVTYTYDDHRDGD
jgi:arginine N-succinyltransferase